MQRSDRLSAAMLNACPGGGSTSRHVLSSRNGDEETSQSPANLSLGRLYSVSPELFGCNPMRNLLSPSCGAFSSPVASVSSTAVEGGQSVRSNASAYFSPDATVLSDLTWTGSTLSSATPSTVVVYNPAMHAVYDNNMSSLAHNLLSDFGDSLPDEGSASQQLSVHPSQQPSGRPAATQPAARQSAQLTELLTTQPLGQQNRHHTSLVTVPPSAAARQASTGDGLVPETTSVSLISSDKTSESARVLDSIDSQLHSIGMERIPAQGNGN